MVLIITALMIEAKPIIRHFKLKKDMTLHAYPVFRNGETALIVGGTGKVKSAMAAVYLFSLYGSDKRDILINIGFCGSSSNLYSPGSLLAVNRVSDMDTGMDYYPDIFWGRELPKKALCCYSRPVRRSDLKTGSEVFCDMESAGIMEAARKFAYAHQTAIVKVISDDLTPDNLDKKLLEGYMEKHMPCLEQIINELKQLGHHCDKLVLDEEKRVLDAISRDLRFTEAMKQMLFKEIKKAKQQGAEPLDILKPHEGIIVNSKNEGKISFEKIIGELKQKDV